MRLTPVEDHVGVEREKCNESHRTAETGNRYRHSRAGPDPRPQMRDVNQRKRRQCPEKECQARQQQDRPVDRIIKIEHGDADEIADKPGKGIGDSPCTTRAQLFTHL
jgi:hypothetical protein